MNYLAGLYIEIKKDNVNYNTAISIVQEIRKYYHVAVFNYRKGNIISLKCLIRGIPVKDDEMYNTIFNAEKNKISAILKNRGIEPDIIGSIIFDAEEQKAICIKDLNKDHYLIEDDIIQFELPGVARKIVNSLKEEEIKVSAETELVEIDMSKVNRDEKTMTEDEQYVLNLFRHNKVDPEQFDGKHGIYKFAAVMYNNKAINLQGIINYFEMSPIRPSYVLDTPRYIEIDWMSNHSQVVNSREQYINLIFEFLDYLKEISLDGLILSTGIFNDSADELFSTVNTSPSFNEECFGNDSKISRSLFNF